MQCKLLHTKIHMHADTHRHTFTQTHADTKSIISVTQFCLNPLSAGYLTIIMKFQDPGQICQFPQTFPA